MYFSLVGKDVGFVLSETSVYCDVILLTKTATILPWTLLITDMNLKGPSIWVALKKQFRTSLVQFITMIEHGADTKPQLGIGASRANLAIAQLMQCNSHANVKQEFRHGSGVAPAVP